MIILEKLAEVKKKKPPGKMQTGASSRGSLIQSRIVMRLGIVISNEGKNPHGYETLKISPVGRYDT